MQKAVARAATIARRERETRRDCVPLEIFNRHARPPAAVAADFFLIRALARAALAIARRWRIFTRAAAATTRICSFEFA